MNIGAQSITIAQLWGVYEGIQLAWNLGIKKLLIEVDNKYVVQMMEHEVVRINGHSSLILAIHSLLSKEWQVHIKHVHHEENFTVDCLTGEAWNYSFGFHILDGPPNNLLHWLDYDAREITADRLVMV